MTSLKYLHTVPVQEDDHLLHLLPVGMEEVLEEVGDALIGDVTTD